MRPSTNIELLFTEAGPDLADRVRAAAAAGIEGVELWNTSHLDIPSLARALRETGVEVVSLVAEPRATLVDVGTHADYLVGMAATCDRAAELGCTRIVVGSGIGVPFLSRSVQHGIVVDVLRRAAEVARTRDVVLVLENLNTRVDHPGILFDTTAECAAAIRAVDSPHLRLLYDVYHSLSMGEDPLAELAAVGDLVDHVQIASVPGRHEPGSDETDWNGILATLSGSGYRGWVGLEYHPTSETRASLAEVRAAQDGMMAW